MSSVSLMILNFVSSFFFFCIVPVRALSMLLIFSKDQLFVSWIFSIFFCFVFHWFCSYFYCLLLVIALRFIFFFSRFLGWELRLLICTFSLFWYVFSSINFPHSHALILSRTFWDIFVFFHLVYFLLFSFRLPFLPTVYLEV